MAGAAAVGGANPRRACRLTVGGLAVSSAASFREPESPRRSLRPPPPPPSKIPTKPPSSLLVGVECADDGDGDADGDADADGDSDASVDEAIEAVT